MAISSLVSGDCIVSGSEVRNSLLFTGVPDAFLLQRSNMWWRLPQVMVNRKRRLKNCVIDRGVIIPEGLVVGEDPDEDARWFRRDRDGDRAGDAGHAGCARGQAWLSRLGRRRGLRTPGPPRIFVNRR